MLPQIQMLPQILYGQPIKVADPFDFSANDALRLLELGNEESERVTSGRCTLHHEQHDEDDVSALPNSKVIPSRLQYSNLGATFTPNPASEPSSVDAAEVSFGKEDQTRLGLTIRLAAYNAKVLKVRCWINERRQVIDTA